MIGDCRNPDHATQPRDYCAGCACDCETELTRTRDMFQRLLNGQSDETRRTYATARRTAWDHVHGTIGRFYWAGIPDKLMPHVRNALYRAAQTDPAMGRRLLDRSRLESLATEAGRALADWDKRAAQVAAEAAADPREAEITRLRQVITTAGQRLHRETAWPPPGSVACQCAGCELIRDMDTVGLPEPDRAGGT